MYHRLQIRLLNQLTKDVGHIKERGASAEPGMINTATRMKPAPATAAEAEDRDTLFDDIHSVAVETEHGQGLEVAPG